MYSRANQHDLPCNVAISPKIDIMSDLARIECNIANVFNVISNVYSAC